MILDHQFLELIVVVDRNGRLLAVNSNLPGDASWQIAHDDDLWSLDLTDLAIDGDWASRALNGQYDAELNGLVAVDRSRSPLTVRLGATRSEGETDPHAFFVRYAAPVIVKGETVGAVGVYVPWHGIQALLDRVENDFVGAGYPSGYAYMVGRDNRTLIGHQTLEYYGTYVDTDHQLPDVVAAIAARDTVFEYEFPPGTSKIAGLALSQSPYGFEWTIGTGIDFPDIYFYVQLVGVAFGVFVVTLTLLATTVAVRMTRRFRLSVEQLIETAGLVARGEMPRAVDIPGGDEIGHLAAAFNEMAATLNRRFSQQMSETPFTPIRPNPYILGNPIKGKKLFYGRRAEFDQARELLARAAGGLVIVFCGERRSGKTSILYQIRNGELGEQFLPIFVDLQAFAASASEEAFFEALLMELAEEAEKDEEIGEIDWDREAKLGPDALRSFLQQLVQDAAPRRILILFDEYEIFDTLIAKGYLSDQITLFLASFTETDPPVSFIFSGSGSLEDDEGEHWEPLFAKSHAIPIGPLHRDDALRLITEPVEGLVEYDAGVPSSIFRLTGGQPYYTQAICQSLVDQLNRVRHNICDARDLTAVVDEVVSNPPPQMIYFWNQLNQTEKFTFALLADCLEDPWGAADPREVTRRRAQFSEGEPLTAFVVQRILDHWVSTGFLERVEEGGYRFRMDLFRQRIRRFHSVWQVLREESKT